MIKPSLIVSAPASSRSCYGDRSRDLIRSLIKMNKYSVSIIDQRYNNAPMDSLPEDFMPLIHTGYAGNNTLGGKTLAQQPDIFMAIGTPDTFQKIGKYNIGVTAGPETDRAPSAWMEGLNRMDLVIVPSEHSKKVFQTTHYQTKDNKTHKIVGELKLNTKLEVLFEGLDLTIFNPSTKNCEKVCSVLDSIPEKNCYLVSGHWGPGDFSHDHRDIGGSIRTFLESFKNKAAKNQPALVVKVSKGSYSLLDREDMLDRIRQIRSSIETTGQVPNVYLLHGDLTVDELNALYHHNKIKAMISFSKGGAFGRSLLEFGITGKPILVGGWTGHLDFLSEHGLLLVGQQTEVHPSSQMPEGANWYYVDYGYAAGLIKDVNSDYKKHLVKSRKQKQYLKNNFTLDKMTELFTKQLEDNVPSFEIELPKLESLETYE